MGKRKKIRKHIAGRERAIQHHLGKIAREKSKPYPNQRLIEYWGKEISRRRKEIEKLRRRLRPRED